MTSETPSPPSRHREMWTFENALLVLISPAIPLSQLVNLDDFLLENKQVILDPNPFHAAGDEKHDTKVTVRGVSYTIEDADVAVHVAKATATAYSEVVRIISQSPPQGLLPQKKDQYKLKLPDDRQRLFEKSQISYYSHQVLRQRRTVLQLAAELLRQRTNPEKLMAVQNIGKELFISDYLRRAIATLETAVDSTLLAPGEVEPVLYIVELLRVIFELMLQNPGPDIDTTLEWFNVCAKYNYLLPVGPMIIVDYQGQFELVKGLCTLISVLFLDLERSFDVAAVESLTPALPSYFNNEAAFSKINKIVCQDTLSIDSPILSYCWLVILLRKYYFIESNLQTFAVEFDLKATIASLEGQITVTEVYSAIELLSQLLVFDLTYQVVLVSIILAGLPLLPEMTPKVANIIAKVVKITPEPVIEAFFSDESVQANFVLLRTKFPMLLTPFISLALINGRFAFTEFTNLRSYMSEFSKIESDKISVVDDENTELVKLKQPVELYPPFEFTKKLSLLLEPGTKAKVLPLGDANLVLMTFLYRFSGWGFLGRILFNISRFGTSQDLDSCKVAVESLQLVNQVLIDGTSDEVRAMIHDMLTYDDDLDVFEVVVRLLEQWLHTRYIDGATAGITFLRLVLPDNRARVWAYLSKLSLFANDGNQGFAAALFGVEAVVGDYHFTIAMAKLAEELVRDCMVWSQHPVPQPQVMVKFSQHLLVVFESFIHCQFNHSFDKLELGISMLLTFSKLLVAEYAIDYPLAVSELAKLVYLLFMLTEDSALRLIIPFLELIDLLASNLNVYEAWDISGYVYTKWVEHGLQLCKLLVDIHSTQNPTSLLTLELQLLSKVPQMVSAYVQYQFVKRPIIDLLTSLVRVPQLPLLLSYMGQVLAEVFVRLVKRDLENLLMSLELKNSVYQFIGAIMNGETQQGMLVLLVTDDIGKVLQLDIPNLKLMISILKSNVDFVSTPNTVTYHLLDAIALTFNSWVTVRELPHAEDDSKFIDMLVAHLSKQDKLVAVQRWGPEGGAGISANTVSDELQVVLKIGEILALYLFTTSNKAEYTKIIDAATKLPFSDFFAVSQYRPQLYTDVEAIFAHYGSSALKFYNKLPMPDFVRLDLMQQAFGQVSDWGLLERGTQAAAANKRFLMAQVDVAKLTGALVVALCRKYPTKVTPEMLQVAATILQLDYDEGIPAAIFELVFNERIEVAFYLVYCVLNDKLAKPDSKVVFDIIKLALTLISLLVGVSFLSQLSGNSPLYTLCKGNYRPLLRILFCGVTMIKEDSRLIFEHFSVFREVFELMTAAIRTILNEFLNKVYLKKTDDINPLIDDLTLVLSIIKAILGVKFVDANSAHHEFARVIENEGTIKALLNFYSQAHKVEVNLEFVFARLSLQFIQVLVSIDEVIADKFVQAGLFIVLVESPMLKPLRAGRVTVTTDPQYHWLWINGILPIFITVLSKIGPGAIPEVSLALQLFGKQIELCILQWGNDSSSIQVATTSISETGQILLIYEILKLMCALDYLVAMGSVQNQGEGEDAVDMPMLPGLDTPGKREKFSLCLTNLLKHPKFLATRIVPSSKEEKGLIEAGGNGYDEFVKVVIGDIVELKDGIEYRE